MASASRMVESRWAITIRVLRPDHASRACCTARSLSVSSAEVASSKIQIGASLYKARAIARRWRCPPESLLPLAPIGVSTPSGRRCTKSHRWAARSAASSRASSRGWA
mmetsp:Transcript_70431/g.165846  ORF Transcript_70431/g.165846 Transcript_70431/m.165846 type:complete len:108 (+) Transcript_70431:237-560(+)